MEKIWFHYFRLITLSALSIFAISPDIKAQEADVKSVTVDVEVPVEADNMAAAKEAARTAAFEKALDQLLSINMEPKLRAEKIKKASRVIKSFQVVSEQLEGAVLKQTIKCEVLVEPEAAAAVGPVSDQKATFEVAWLPDEVQFNAVDVLKFVSDTMGTPAASVRIGRGNIVVTIPLRKSIEETQIQLATFVGKRGLVKVIRRDENRPPDMLPAPIVVPPSSVPTPLDGSFAPMPAPAPVPVEPAPMMPSSGGMGANATPLPPPPPAMDSAPTFLPAPAPEMPPSGGMGANATPLPPPPPIAPPPTAPAPAPAESAPAAPPVQFATPLPAPQIQ